jgi:hypothetical protein
MDIGERGVKAGTAGAARERICVEAGRGSGRRPAEGLTLAVCTIPFAAFVVKKPGFPLPWE